MKLQLWNLVSREQIDTSAVPDRDWRAVRCGGHDFLLTDSSCRVYAFRLDETLETVSQETAPTALPNVRIAVPDRLDTGAAAVFDTYGRIYSRPSRRDTDFRLPKGVRAASFGSCLAAVTLDGCVYVRSESGEWHQPDIHMARDISAGPACIAVRLSDGSIRLTDRNGTVMADTARAEAALGTAEAMSVASGCVLTLRDGFLRRNGRVLSTGGGGITQLACGIGKEFDFAVCRRADGSFLTVLLSSQPTPASLTVPGCERVGSYDAGSCFMACLIEEE